MAFAAVNGLVLHYRLHGRADAPVLVLANALGTDARIWDEVIARLADDYRILSYDKRGHGLSETPAGECTIDDHVADLTGLLDHLDMARLALAGISIGGIIAQRFALLHGDRLDALILCDTAPKIGDAALWDTRIETATRDGMTALSNAVMQRWFTAHYGENNKTDLAGWRTMFERMPARGYAASCAALRDADLRNQVAAIAVPTLLIVGEEDLSTPADLVRALADAIPGARFENIAGSGHIPSIDNPAALSALIHQFLREVGHG